MADTFNGVINSGIGALDRIVASKTREVLTAAAQISLDAVKNACTQAPPVQGFAARLDVIGQDGSNALICEIKRRSPSAGDILAGANPVAIATEYAMAGAACLSILTDGPFFGGSLQDVDAVRAQTNLPILRKDFIVSGYQIYEARAHGADCVLLIVAILEDSLLKDLAELAFDLGMDVLIEVHTAAELARALDLPHSLLGINNRDLRIMKTNLDTTTELVREIPDGHFAPIVSESGVHSVADIMHLRQSGARRFLIGESLLMSDRRAALLAELKSAQ